MFRTFLAAATLIALPALAQDKPKDPPKPAPQDDAVVTGNRDKDKRVDSFVRSLAPSRDGRQVARWNGEVCAKVLNLWPEKDKVILDRIAAVAKTIGVRFKTAPNCDPNTLILFTGNADKMTAAAIDEFPALITNAELNGLPPRKEIARYLVPRPVRWFAINSTTTETGTPVGSMNRDGAGSGTGAPNINASPSSIAASRIGMRTRENTVATLIVVDEGKLGGIKWSQLADYLAMVTFAQPAIDADFSATDSVMAIFSERDAGRPGAPGMTLQDETFLVALYKAAVNLQSSAQQGVIGDALKKGAKKN